MSDLALRFAVAALLRDLDDIGFSPRGDCDEVGVTECVDLIAYHIPRLREALQSTEGTQS